MDVCYLKLGGGAIWCTLTKLRQAWCNLQVKLCVPCLSTLRLCMRSKWRCINTLPFLSFISRTKFSPVFKVDWLIKVFRPTHIKQVQEWITVHYSPGAHTESVLNVITWPANTGAIKAMYSNSWPHCGWILPNMTQPFVLVCNQLWQISCRSTEGCRFCRGGGVKVFHCCHWQAQLPLTQGRSYSEARVNIRRQRGLEILIYPSLGLIEIKHAKFTFAVSKTELQIHPYLPDSGISCPGALGSPGTEHTPCLSADMRPSL